MKKSLAQVAYEAFTATFDIKIQGNFVGGKVMHGPAPWSQLRPIERAKWIAVAMAVRGAIDPMDCVRRMGMLDKNGPYQCECGARLMRGEKHACRLEKKTA